LHSHLGTATATHTATHPVIKELTLETLLGSSDVVLVAWRTNAFSAPIVSQPTYVWEVCYPNPLRDANTFLAGLRLQRFESAASIAAKIDAVIADNNLYEPDEPRPSPETVTKAKDLIMSAEQGGSKLPHPKVSMYFGEIDITWTVEKRLLRLIIFADPTRPAVLYFQTDKGEALTRGESEEVRSTESLSRKLAWLLG
jgi:hypothetical protein